MNREYDAVRKQNYALVNNLTQAIKEKTELKMTIEKLKKTNKTFSKENDHLKYFISELNKKSEK